jgi:protein TonB
MSIYARNITAIGAAVLLSLFLVMLQPVLLKMSAPARKEHFGEAVKLADYRKAPPPPPKKEEIKKEVKPKEQKQPDLKSFMPKMDMDSSGLANAPFQFDLGLSTGGEGGMGLSLGIFDESRVDAKPVPLFRAKPVYPSAAMSKNITGKVRFKMLVDPDGMVKTVEILGAEPQGVFEEATMDAVRQWRFQPAKVKGSPVACWCQSSIKYELDLQ